MFPATSNKALAALICMALIVCSPSVFAQKSPAQWLSVDMPHGGCSLTVGEDGSASIHFGAMPKWVRVPPGTFNFEQLAKWLRAKSHPQSARKAAGAVVGSLSLPDSKDLLFIDERHVVRSLLERAWGVRTPPDTPLEVEDYAWVSGVCSLK